MIVKSIGNRHWEVAFDDPKLENEKVTYNQLIHDRDNAGSPERLRLMTSFSRPILAMDSTEIETMLVIDDADDDDSGDVSESFDDAEASDAESDEDIAEPQSKLTNNESGNPFKSSEETEYDLAAFGELHEDKEFKKRWKSMTREQ
jgi:hypothetical protein